MNVGRGAGWSSALRINCAFARISTVRVFLVRLATNRFACSRSSSPAPLLAHPSLLCPYYSKTFFTTREKVWENGRERARAPFRMPSSEVCPPPSVRLFLPHLIPHPQFTSGIRFDLHFTLYVSCPLFAPLFSSSSVLIIAVLPLSVHSFVRSFVSWFMRRTLVRSFVFPISSFAVISSVRLAPSLRCTPQLPFCKSFHHRRIIVIYHASLSCSSPLH